VSGDDDDASITPMSEPMQVHDVISASRGNSRRATVGGVHCRYVAPAGTGQCPFGTVPRPAVLPQHRRPESCRHTWRERQLDRVYVSADGAQSASWWQSYRCSAALQRLLAARNRHGFFSHLFIRFFCTSVSSGRLDVGHTCSLRVLRLCYSVLQRLFLVCP